MFGFLTGTLLGIIGVCYKDSIMFKYEIHTEPRPAMVGFSLSHKLDWSMMPKGPQYWTRGPNPAPAEPKC